MSVPIYIHDIISPRQCGILIKAAAPRLKEMKIAKQGNQPHTVIQHTQEFRFHQDIPETILLKSIACKLSDTDKAETVKITKYEEDQFFGPHLDGLNRKGTLVVFLNAGYAGGQLYFPHYETTYSPDMPGGGVFWLNTPISIHEGKQVYGGEKWIATIWTHQ